MKRMCIIGCMTVALAGGFSLLAGCEDEVAREKKVKVDDGKVKTDETTVREQPNGDITIERERTTRERDDGVIESETQRKTETIPNP